MAGIYIHVPFCSSRCIYCDFYSTTYGVQMRENYVDALCHEIETRKRELEGQCVRTIYFGGGTPSLLALSSLEKILKVIRGNFELAPSMEVTLESNPDDVTETLANGWWNLGINRVSLGLQTFQDEILKLLRRRHTSQTAREAVSILRETGFRNLSLDLIYGLPGQTMEVWEDDVRQILSLPLQHLSAYALSYEPGTQLTRMLERKEIVETDEETLRKMYELLVDRVSKAGFEHYEISNFALPDFQSRHNSSYWSGEPYLGVGPGAHSYDGKKTRRANEPDLKNYIAHVSEVPCVVEHLDQVQLFEEYLLTGLRTARGISQQYVRSHFGERVYNAMRKLAMPHLEKGALKEIGDQLSLTFDGIFISDYIMSDLMLAGDE